MECVFHRPGEEALLNLFCSHIALLYTQLGMCIVYLLLCGQVRTQQVEIVELVPL